jgi:hypothetical protein
MPLYFGKKEPITDTFEIETQLMIQRKSPLIRSQILIQRENLKRLIVRGMLVDEMNKRIKAERESR